MGKTITTTAKKLPWTVVLYQDSHRETDCRSLIQLELNRTTARRCCLFCPFCFIRRIDCHSSLKNSGGLIFVLENLSIGCLTIYNIEEWSVTNDKFIVINSQKDNWEILSASVVSQRKYNVKKIFFAFVVTVSVNAILFSAIDQYSVFTWRHGRILVP